MASRNSESEGRRRTRSEDGGGESAPRCDRRIKRGETMTTGGSSAGNKSRRSQSRGNSLHRGSIRKLRHFAVIDSLILLYLHGAKFFHWKEPSTSQTFAQIGTRYIYTRQVCLMAWAIEYWIEEKCRDSSINFWCTYLGTVDIYRAHYRHRKFIRVQNFVNYYYMSYQRAA